MNRQNQHNKYTFNSMYTRTETHSHTRTHTKCCPVDDTCKSALQSGWRCLVFRVYRTISSKILHAGEKERDTHTQGSSVT